jgi:Fur family ferric uptake transcriptional regulator
MDENITARAGEFLSSAKLRRTSARMAVLTALLKSDRPLTQEQISDMTGSHAPNKVTIYRTLESFVDADIVHKAFLQDRTWHFELAHNCSKHQCHPHFSCTGCGQTHCMTDVAMPMAKAQNGYIVHHQRVQLEGLCPRCSKAG